MPQAQNSHQQFVADRAEIGNGKALHQPLPCLGQGFSAKRRHRGFRQRRHYRLQQREEAPAQLRVRGVHEAVSVCTGEQRTLGVPVHWCPGVHRDLGPNANIWGYGLSACVQGGVRGAGMGAG
jgi:hypothetical protein